MQRRTEGCSIEQTTERSKRRILFVTGGVISGIGKGILSASLGSIIQGHGHRIQMIKIDPYFNKNAGFLHPEEHGEVFVLDDGAETDLDIGTYERFLGRFLTRTSCLTNGEVYQEILGSERTLNKGQTLQVVPHLIRIIRERLLEQTKDADLLIVEIGGTVGDLESDVFLETITHMKTDRSLQIGHLHVAYCPEGFNSEIKTKPAQRSIRECMRRGVTCDLVALRTHQPITNDRTLLKIRDSCGMVEDHLFNVPQFADIGQVSRWIIKAGMVRSVMSLLELQTAGPDRIVFPEFYLREYQTTVRIGLLSKYSINQDSYLSLLQGLKIAAKHNDHNLEIRKVESVADLHEIDGLVIPGGFGYYEPRWYEVLNHARITQLPTLGICLGLQLMVIEYCRNVLGIRTATTEESEQDGKELVIHRIGSGDEIVGDQTTGSIVLGGYDLQLCSDFFEQIYGQATIRERFRHRYGINPSYIESMQADWIFDGLIERTHPFHTLIALKEHPFYVAVQFHPEWSCSFARVHPMLEQLIKQAIQTDRDQSSTR